jgi:hypothetical protein
MQGKTISSYPLTSTRVSGVSRTATTTSVKEVAGTAMSIHLAPYMALSNSSCVIHNTHSKFQLVFNSVLQEQRQLWQMFPFFLRIYLMLLNHPEKEDINGSVPASS